MKKIARILLSLSMMFTVFALDGPLPVKAAATCDTVESCQAEKDKLAKEKEKLQKDIDANSAEAETQYDALYDLEDKISVMETEISVLELAIGLLGEKKDGLEADILDKETLLLERFGKMQRQEHSNVFLSILANSTSFSDMLRKLRIFQSFNADDARLVEEVKTARDEIEKTQKEEEANKKSVEDSLLEIEASKADLATLLEKLIEKQSAMEDEMEDIAFSESEIDRQKSEAEKFREEEENNNNGGNNGGNEGGNEGGNNGGNNGGNEGGNNGGNNGGNEGGNTKPPVKPTTSWQNPGSGTQIITCGRGCYGGHLGVDFGMSYESLRAINRGRVVYAAHGYNGGFGNMIVIHHYIGGENYVSINAHLSEIYVSEGNVVDGGQVIGVTGNTGISTGPHLHLELVRGVDYYPSRWEREAYGVDVTNYIPGPFTWY